MINLSNISQAKQKGFILLITLVLIVVLTVLALTQISLNSTQTRIAANASDLEISFEKTEGAVNEAINLLLNGTYVASSFSANGNGLYLLNANSTPLWSSINWNSSTSVKNSFQGVSGNRASYIIEKLPSVIQAGQNMKSPTNIYRITARSLSESGNSSVLVQSTLKVQ